MPRFIKKPITVEAIQFTDQESADLVLETFGDLVQQNIDHSTGETFSLTLHSLSGPVLVQVNDWVIDGGEGDLYPCKPARFEELFVEDES